MKVLHSAWQQIWKTQQWPQDWKRTVFIPSPKKGNIKESSNHCTNLLFHMPVSLWVKSFKLGFSSIRTENFRMYKWGLGKAEAPVIKLSTFVASWRSKGILGGKSDFCFIDYAKPFDWVDHNKLWKILKRWEYHITLQFPEKPVWRWRSNSWNNT